MRARVHIDGIDGYREEEKSKWLTIVKLGEFGCAFASQVPYGELCFWALYLSACLVHEIIYLKTEQSCSGN